MYLLGDHLIITMHQACTCHEAASPSQLLKALMLKHAGI